MTQLTREEALSMAREAGLALERHYENYPWVANRVYQKEIEALVALAYKRGVEDAAVTASRVSVAAAAAIRNRSTQT